MGKLTHADLQHFSGTEKWYRHIINKNMLYTDGVQFLAEKGGTYWLIHEIAFAQEKPELSSENFQSWTLTVNEDSSASLVCDDGNKNILLSKKIPFTDFPLSKVKIYCVDNVLLLPSEY